VGSAALTEPSPEPREDLPGCPPTLGSSRGLGIASWLCSGGLFWLAVVLQHLTTPRLRAGRSCGCRKWPRTYLAGQIRPRRSFKSSSMLQPKTGWIIPKYALSASKRLVGRRRWEEPSPRKQHLPGQSRRGPQR